MPIRPDRTLFDIFLRHLDIPFLGDPSQFCSVMELKKHLSGKTNTNDRICELKLGVDYMSTANGCMLADAFVV
jgi:hypothetical protein